jgi:hypothetical protein
MTRPLEIRGFYLLLGAILMLLILGRFYRGIVIKDKPANVVQPDFSVGASA